ncbi:hypothetical protein [Rhodoligotrophos ferricapiens]|uniref:hypothetical protein n=1 Tax=Rhodoligotrophos ferricapiens TaxID=3069264 RepID=UPI00315D06A3
MLWMRAACRFARVVCLALASLSIAMVVTADASSTWRRHVDNRLGLSVDLPAKGFVAADPAPGNEGIRLVASDGSGEISVYSVPLSSMSFSAFRRQLIEGARDYGARITYTAGGDNWFVFSGLWKDQIVYYKVLLKQVCGTPTAHQFHLRYPRNQKRSYDPVIARMDDTLRSSPQPVCR